MLNFVKPYRLGVNSCSSVLPNAIDISRLDLEKPRSNHKVFSFLTFGGRNVNKRIDLVIAAGQEIAKQRNDFRILITRGKDTEQIVSSYITGEYPSWLELIDQSDNVSEIYSSADCFISASDGETFSYAVAEATLMRLPVIQSDIDGTAWNRENPSTFIFPKGNIRLLTEQMLTVLNADKTELGIKCKQTFETNRDKLSLDTWCTKVIDVYHNVLND